MCASFLHVFCCGGCAKVFIKVKEANLFFLIPFSSSTKGKPYSPPGHQQPRKSRNIKTVSGSYNVSDSDEDDDDGGVKIEEIN